MVMSSAKTPRGADCALPFLPPGRGRGSVLVNLEQVRWLSSEYLLEILEYIDKCHTELKRSCNSTTIKKHLASSERHHPLCQNLPPVKVSRRVIRYALRNYVGHVWGRIAKKSGGNVSPEKATERATRIRVFALE